MSDHTDLTHLKSEIREAMGARRIRLSLSAQVEAAQKILEFVRSGFNWPEIQAIALYCAIGGELGTKPLDQWLRTKGKTLFFPRTHLKDWTLEMVEMGPGDPWVESALGIEEPPPGKVVTVAAKIDLVFIPGLAFDRAGRRIGRGKGCYDRWLKDFSGIRVGLAHGFQLLKEIPEAPFDQGVDYVITPEEFFQVDRKA